jgi:TrmH family RNA methyltransferase
MLQTIHSTDNDYVKHVTSLHKAKYRAEKKQFIAEGFRTIATIIKAGYQPITVFVTDEFLYDAQQLTNDKCITIVSAQVMKKISTSVSPSGLLALFAIQQQPSLTTLTAGIVLAQIADPGNMGTLIRTAAAMNKKTIVCIETVDPWNPKVVQASAGALSMVNIFCISWHELLKHKNNISLCALLATDGKDPQSTDLRNALIVVGNEGHGIPDEWIADCDEQITLPMPGNFESLNAAVAGSIALYLAATQQ